MPPEEGQPPVAPAAAPTPEGTNVFEGAKRIAAILGEGGHLASEETPGRAVEEAPDRPRGPDGKFLSTKTDNSNAPAQGEPDTGEQPTSEDEQTTEEATPPASATSDPPPTLPAPVREKWKDLPPEIASALSEHETARNRDTSRRLEEAATERKTAVEKATAATREELQTATQQYVTSLQRVAPMLVREYEDAVKGFQEKHKTPPDRADVVAWVEYQQDKEEVAQKRAKLDEWARGWEQQAERVQSEASAKAEERRAECHKALATAWPDDFGEEEKALKSYKAIGEWLMDGKNFKSGKGFPRDMVIGLDNPDIYEIVRDARAYRALMAKKPAASTTASDTRPAPSSARPAAPKLLQPGTSQERRPNGEAYTAARKKLAASGRVDDAADAIKAIIG